MKQFLVSNKWQYRMLRTMLQGVIGVFIANIDLIISYFNFDPAAKTIIVALSMAVWSAIMAELGKTIETENPLLNYDDEDYLYLTEQDLKILKGQPEKE